MWKAHKNKIKKKIFKNINVVKLNSKINNNNILNFSSSTSTSLKLLFKLDKLFSSCRKYTALNLNKKEINY